MSGNDGISTEGQRSVIAVINSLSSVYSIKLFERLSKLSPAKSLQVSLNDLVSQLDVPYKRYTEIAKRVIKPAITELNKKANLNIVWKPIKRGHSVVMVEFSMGLAAT